MNEKREIKWINGARFVAVLAVLICHSYTVLYTDYDVAYLFLFTVPVFIFVSGMVSYSSIERHNYGWFKTFIKSSKTIFLAYLLANFIYLVWMSKYFDLKTYLLCVAGFGITGPFYYVLLYLQLMLVSKFLYNAINYVTGKYSLLWQLFLGAVILGISSYTTLNTNIYEVYGGGGKLLGGTYLFLFFVGMIFTKYKIFENMTARKSLIFTVCGLTAWLGWWRFMCRYEYKLDTYLPFGPGFNPPSITLTVEALCVLVFSCGLFSLIDSSDKLRPVMSGISWLGKHTLYVFLYHKFFLDYILIPYMPECNIWIKRVVYMSVMIFGSIAIEYSVHFLQGIFKDKDKAPA